MPVSKGYELDEGIGEMRGKEGEREPNEVTLEVRKRPIISCLRNMNRRKLRRTPARKPLVTEVRDELR